MRRLLLTVSVLLTAQAAWATPQCAALADLVSRDEMASDLARLEGFGTRVTGYKGCYEAAAWVEQRLRDIGFTDLDSQEYDVAVPVALDRAECLRAPASGAAQGSAFYLPEDELPLGEPRPEDLPEHAATLTVLAADGTGGGGDGPGAERQEFVLHPVWPNLARTSQLPPDGIQGHLIYVGTGELADYNGRDVRGAVVLLDFNTGLNWLNAPLLGAAAVIFMEPENTVRGEAETKFLRVPVSVPRFWIDGRSAMRLRARLAGSAGRSARGAGPAGVPCIVRCRMPWMERQGWNIIAFVPGRELREEAVVIEAYYDSISVVPSCAPGAENGASLAAFFQLARTLKRHPPKRSVVLVATSGHFEAMAGAREFVDLWGKEPRKAREKEDRLRELQEQLRSLQEAPEARKAELSALEAKRREPRGELAPDEAGQLSRLQAAQLRLDRQRARLEHDIALHQRLLRYERMPMFIGIDLSTHSSTLGAFQIGWYFQQQHLMRFYSPVGKRLSEYAEDIASALGVAPADAFVDGINPVKGRDWYTHFPGKICFDSEMAIRGGRPGITFATVNDARPLVDTPLDTAGRTNLDNLVAQTRFLVCLVHDFLNDETHADDALKRVQALKKLDELKDITGSVFEFRRKQSFLPSTPVPHSLVLVKGTYRMMMGTHTDICTLADENAGFTLRGETDSPTALLEAYAFDPNTGDITYAPDVGPEGDVRYPRQAYGRAGLKRPIIVFPCAAVSLYDLVDERYFETLERIFVFNARDFSEPINYGYSLPDTGAGGGELPSYVEPCAVVYSPRDINVQVAMGMGLLGLRMVLTNGPDREAFKQQAALRRKGPQEARLRYEGYGFPAVRTPSIPFTPYQVASDMWVLDEGRMSELRQRGIRNGRLEELHALAEASLKRADAARSERRYDAFIGAARNAWAYESRAYPDVQRTATDVVKGVLFYLAMLLPFAYFCERLLFAVPEIKTRIGVTFAIFALIFGILFLVHPAFKLPRLNPLIILLSFVILALAIIVIAIVTGKFNETLKQMKREEGGQHEADVGRWSAASAAFALGIGNMRRRKTRTALTCVTLVLLTFTVLSFMSVESWIRPNRIRLSYRPAYQGIMIRDRSWSSLEEPAADIVHNELGDRGSVAPRAWFSSPDIEKEIFIDIRSVADPSKTYAANVLLGLSSEETRVTPMARALLPGGRWFATGEKDACILPESVAAGLGIGPGDVGRAEVSIFGGRFRVVGLLNEKEFRGIGDLDGEALSPVNYAQLRPEIIQEIKQQAQQRFKLGSEGTASLLQEYRHYPPYSLAVLPYRTVMDLGGTLRSVAIRFNDAADVGSQVARLVKRYALSLYAGEGEHAYLYSSVGLTKVGRLGTLAVPILIAALIVLNTMLGAVYERTKEIAIFSSIGLAPIHVSMLFLAEASVFANIGAILGYLLGQVVAKVLERFHMLAGIELNYSSLAAVGVTVIVVAVVLLSTIWPSKRAAEIASPGLERKWRMPEPEGDVMTLVLPFTVTGRDAIGSCAFLKEYFDEFVGYAGGEFLAEDVRMQSLAAERGTGIQIRLRIWLAPYDLGVSQRFELNAQPTGESQIYAVRIRLLREAGDISSWVKTNALFLTALRKQFLIWRTVSVHNKQIYADRGQAIIEGREEAA